jgi:hypothetical protein
MSIKVGDTVIVCAYEHIFPGTNDSIICKSEVTNIDYLPWPVGDHKYIDYPSVITLDSGRKFSAVTLFEIKSAATPYPEIGHRVMIKKSD